jgi:NAD(P)-dependent dehydrogenase (short-subunit alcohol dehydrogenase family)
MSEEMKNKTVLVTGANSGIGYETVVGLARKGAKVLMACRERKRGEDALASAKEASGNDTIELFLADFSSLDQVRRLAEEVKLRFRRLDVLVNNAGGIFARHALSADGYEWTFAVNHLAPFLLTNLLRPLFKPQSRVVTVSSEAHRTGRIDFDDLMAENRYAMFKAYAQSKLANILFASELGRRLSGSGITSNSLHPGVVRTRWGQTSGTLLKTALRFAGIFMISPEQGARTSIYLASAPEVQGVTGRYFKNCREANPSAEALNENVANRLWNVSARMVDL